MARNPAEISHGPMMIGFFICSVLYGILTMQVLNYPKSSPGKNDKSWIKYFIGVLYFAETLQTIFAFTFLYQSLVKHYGNPEVLVNADWLFQAYLALTGIIGGSTQLFFGWRVWVLTKKPWLIALICTTAVIGGLGGIGTALAASILKDFSKFGAAKSIVSVWLASEALCDVIITSSMVLHLRKHTGRFAKSDLLIDRIIRLTVQTGLITSLAALTDMLLFLLDTTGDHLLVNIFLSKLYTNSLMSTLNARRSWADNAGPSDVHSSSGGINTVMPTKGVVKFNTQPQEVRVTVESHQMRDMPTGPFSGGHHLDEQKVGQWSDSNDVESDLNKDVMRRDFDSV